MKNKSIVLLLFFVLFCQSRSEIPKTESNIDKDFNYRKKIYQQEKSYTKVQEESIPQIINQQNIILQKKENQKRQIIYESHLEMQVKKIEETIEKIKKSIDSYKGYIEILENRKEENYSYLKIRIPIDHFFNFLDELFQLGNIVKHSIYAEDVSKKLQDIESRIKILKQLRNRLYELFKKATKVEEKAKILKEINRITTEIEELESREIFLKDKATYSTIDLYLRTSESIDKPIFLTTPFDWIQNLNPLQRTIYNEYSPTLQYLFFFKQDTFYTLLKKIKQPENFFNNKENFVKKEDLYLFYSPLNTGIRVGVVPNTPSGNLNFWTIALKQELQKRNYEILSEEKQEESFKITYKINDGIKTYFYTLYIFLLKKEIAVIEIFYPNEISYTNDSIKIKELF